MVLPVPVEVPLLLLEEGGTVEVPVPLVPVELGGVVGLVVLDPVPGLAVSVEGLLVPGVVLPGVVPVVGLVPGVVSGTVCGELGVVLEGIWSVAVPVPVLPVVPVGGFVVPGVWVAPVPGAVVLCDCAPLCPAPACADEVADPVPALPVEPAVPAVWAAIQPADSSKVVTVKMNVRISIPLVPATAGLNY